MLGPLSEYQAMALNYGLATSGGLVARRCRLVAYVSGFFHTVALESVLLLL